MVLLLKELIMVGVMCEIHSPRTSRDKTLGLRRQVLSLPRSLALCISHITAAITKSCIDMNLYICKDADSNKMILLTYWGWVTHICVREFTIIGSNNGLSPSRHQAIIWTNAEILLIRPLGTNFSETLIKIHLLSFNKMHLKYRLRNVGHIVLASMC